MEQSRIPEQAIQPLVSARSIYLQLNGIEAQAAILRAEGQRLLFNANRVGATYEVIAEATDLGSSTVATEIARYRDDHGLPALPRGRRRGISPKSKAQAVA